MINGGDKFYRLFTQYKLADDLLYKQIIEKADLSYKKINNWLTIILTFNITYDFNIIREIEINYLSLKDKFSIQYLIINNNEINLLEILKLFNNINLENNISFNKIIENSTFTKNKIIFNYESDFEYKYLNNIKDEIILYFKNKFCFDISIDIKKTKLTTFEYHNNTIKDMIERKKDSFLNIEAMVFKIPDYNEKSLMFSNPPVYISDYKNSIPILIEFNKYGNKNEQLNKFKSLKPNMWIKFDTNYAILKYKQGYLVNINHIEIIEGKNEYIRFDDAIKPRIELFNHTKMSAYDGLSSIDEIVSYNKLCKTPAIGFADRLNMHAFPDIEKKCKDIKPMYGVELQLMHDKIDICINCSENILLDDVTYVVFDIETTGLNAYFEDVIEIGAIKIKNGVKIDEIDYFIKPTRLISEKITNLTKITNDMVKDAINQKEGLEKFINWIGDCVLIAHNGINFDLNFINTKCWQYSIKQIKNCLIDTMQLSRAINIDLKYHSLGKLCKYFKVQYNAEEAHRANFDAEVLSLVWEKFCEIFRNDKVYSVEQINKNYQTQALFERQYPSYAQVYANNQDSLKWMFKIFSLSLTKQMYGQPTLFYEQLMNNENKLILTSSPFWGDVWECAINKTDDDLKKVISFYDFIFISPPSCFAHEINRNNITLDNVKEAIKRIIKCSAAINIPVVAVSGNYYLAPWEEESHKVFIFNKVLKQLPHRFFKYDEDNNVSPKLFCRTTKEMIEEFSFLDDENLINEIVIENTYKFAELFSKINIVKDKLYTPYIEGVDDKLKNQVNSKLLSIYGEKPNHIITKRVNDELDIIISKGYSVIYWISHLLIKKSNEDGYSVGPRGSVGSSLVAFLSNISEVNPLSPHYICGKCKYHEFSDEAIDGYDLPIKRCPKCGHKMSNDGHSIPFESFLGVKGAEKVPDIDLNFSGEYQNTAHKFIYDMFGNNYSFRAGTILTIQSKTYYGFAKKYYEIKDIEYHPNDAEIDWLGRRLLESKRTNGQHAGGILVVPHNLEITDFTPYQYLEDEKNTENNQDIFVTHFDFHSIHDNLLKFDILGHDVPTIFKLLEEYTGVKYSEANFQDKNVYELFTSLKPLNIEPTDINGETIGTYAIPEMSTSFTMQLIKDVKPTSFNDLIRIAGLSHGTGVWEGNAKQLLKENKDLQISNVICFREDMLDFFAKQGLNPSDSFNIAEKVRKGKGVSDEYVELLRKNNVPEWYIDSCKKVQYLFPKAHATAYSWASYICAWYKIYYGIAYYCVHLTVKLNIFDLSTIVSGKHEIINKINDINKRLNNKDLKQTVTTNEKDMLDIYNVCLEAIARGYKIINVDINKSDKSRFLIVGNNILPPLICVDGLGLTVADSIIEARTFKPFSSIDDISKRTKINQRVLNKMIELGVLNGYKKDDRITIFDL